MQKKYNRCPEQKKKKCDAVRPVQGIPSEIDYLGNSIIFSFDNHVNFFV